MTLVATRDREHNATAHAQAHGYAYEQARYYPGGGFPVALLTIAGTVILQSVPEDKRQEVLSRR